jgi:serine protease Do
MARWPIALFSLVAGGLIGVLVANTHLQGQNTAPPVYPKELTSYRDVVKRVLPAVVSIESKPTREFLKPKQGQNQSRRRPGADLFPDMPEESRRQFEEFLNDRGFSVEEMPRHSFGSGFIVDPKGVILTNYHVIAGTDRVEVTLKDGRKFLSKEIKGDRKNDLAIVRIEPKGQLQALELGDSDAMEIGDRVLAVGAPFRLTGSVTSGIISAKGRDSLSGGVRTVYEDYLQTDAAINPGNSGGPLVNLEGKVIGVNTAIRSQSGGFQGVGLAISSNVAKNIMEQLVRDGTVHRGYLGIGMKALTPEVAEKLGVKDTAGVLVSEVFVKSPAAKAGLKEGDVIQSLGGKPVTDGRGLQRVVGTLTINKPVDATVVRDGKTLVLPITVEEQPENYGLVNSQPRVARTQPSADNDEVTVDKVGLELTDLTSDLARRFQFREGLKGALITGVKEDSYASEAGLRESMLITKIDKKPVGSAEAAKEMLEKAPLEKGILLQVQRPQNLGGGSDFIVLKAEAAKK